MMIYPAKRTYRAILLAACLGMTLAGCGREGGEQPAAKGQVVATVGDQVVTTQELDNEMRWSNVSPDKQKDPEVIKRVLGELVVRKYLLQQALASKLDREPSVLLDLLRARELVLEKGFLTRAAAAKSPGKSEVDRYIANNPSKFANRKLLSIEQIGFPLGSNSQSVIDSNKNAKSLDEIAQQLTSAGIPHGRQMGVLNTGEISQDFYNEIEAKKADYVLFVRSGANGVFFKVKGEEARPLEGEAAANFARQLLRADALKAEAGLAAFSANLEAKYQDEYAKIMQQAAGAPVAKD